MDLLSLQLVQVLQFISMDFNQEMIFNDCILSEVPTGGQFFYPQGRLWFMRNESIPGETSLKAIAFDKKAIYLETGELDVDLAREIIHDHKLDCVINVTRRRITTSGRKTTLFEYGEAVKLKFEDSELEPRIQIKIPLGNNQMSGIDLVDKLWSFGAFKTAKDEDEVGTAKYGERSMKLQLNLGLQQRLFLEQRPMLLLNQRTQLKPETRTELGGVMAQQTRLLSMSPEELEGYVAEYAFENGEKRTQSILDFVLAGKVKKVKPQLTWIDARAIARKLATRATL